MTAAPALEVLTAAEAERRQRALAGSLLAGGLEEGARVAFCLPSSGDLLCAVLGAARAGLVPVLLNPALVPAERRLLLDDAEPARVLDQPGQLAALAGGPPAELAPYPRTRAMHYTSGTTGRPKGVSTGLWDEATAAEVFTDEADLWGFDAADRHLVCSPLHHTVSARFAGGTLLSGGTVALLGTFDAGRALAALREWRPTTTFMAPAHLQRLLAQPDLGATERFDSLRLLAHAGSPCPPALKHQAFARVGPQALWEFYGSTEGQFTVCPPDLWRHHPGTVGAARPGRRLAVTDEGGAPVPAGEVGTIWCHAPASARFTYWRNPEATAAAWRGDAFTVGDLGHLDDEGLLYLSGRRHDLIISGGVNVYPAEVEAALATVDGVDEVAVFGRPDEQWGERVCAAVVGRAVTEERLRQAAAEHLAPYKRPKEYWLCDQLPHTATGKLLRRLVPSALGLAPPPDA